MKSFRALAMAAAILVSVSAWAQEATTVPAAASSPAGKSGKTLEQFIEAIRSAAEPSAAVSAYAQGSALDARSLPLNNAYMRRMLTLGFPQIATHSAHMLNGNDPKNGLAWAVTAYVQGKQGDYPGAIASNTLALSNGMGVDGSVLNNMGQLLAWYDNQEMPPKLPDAVRRIFDKNREDWTKDEDFTKGYAKIKEFYGDWLTEKKAQEAKIAIVETAVQEARGKVAKLDATVRDKDAELSSHKDTQQSLLQELWATADSADVSTARYRSDLQARLRQEKRNIDNIKADMDSLRRDLTEAQNEQRTKQTQIDQLRQAIQTPNKVKLQRLFRWDPPRVDGVLTPEVDKFPIAPAKAATQANDPEALAATRLRLANMYLQNDMYKDATDVLQDIVNRYPNTKAAAEAKTLLAKTPKE